jgi:hypothetical protein
MFRGIVFMVLSALRFGVRIREDNAILLFFCLYINMLSH